MSISPYITASIVIQLLGMVIPSLERIINVPKRNIGESSVNKYKAEAQEANLSLYEYISSIKPEDSEAPKKATINN